MNSRVYINNIHSFHSRFAGLHTTTSRISDHLICKIWLNSYCYVFSSRPITWIMPGMDSQSYLSMRKIFGFSAEIKVTRVAFLNLPSLGFDGSLCPGPLLFSYSGKSTAVGQGGSHCPSEGGALTGCTACMKRQRSGSTAGTRPGTLPRWVEVRFCDVTTKPRKGAGGEIKVKSCIFSSIKKKSLNTTASISALNSSHRKIFNGNTWAPINM